MAVPAIWAYRARVERVIDGDTLDVTIDQGLHTHRTERIRLLGLNVSPNIPTYDVVDRTQRYTERPCHAGLCFAICEASSDFQYIRFGKPGPWVILAARQPLTRNIAPLPDHVGHVVRVGSQEQVVWPNARRVVAAVKDEHPRWDLAKCKLPGNPGRHTRSTVGTPAALESTVPLRASCASPEPAAVWGRLVNLLPETICNGANREFTKARGHVLRRCVMNCTASLRTVDSGAAAIVDELSRTGRANVDGLGRLVGHRDLPLTRNRGAMPRAVSSSDGASLCANFTMIG